LSLNVVVERVITYSVDELCTMFHDHIWQIRLKWHELQSAKGATDARTGVHQMEQSSHSTPVFQNLGRHKVMSRGAMEVCVSCGIANSLL